MAEGCRPSIRIDWFDGSLIEDVQESTSASRFADENEEQPELRATQKLPQTLKLPIGFKRLQDISILKPPILNIEVSNRPGFWNLFDQEELKGDFIVLIVRILANLFKYIQPGESSKLTKLLQTRFLGSDFLEKLIIYVSLLPHVKIVEKRMNALLWDDVQSFFTKILDLCEGCIKFFGENRNKEAYMKIYELLKALCASAIGVAEEHSERFSEELFERIEDLEAIAEVMVERESLETQFVNKRTDPKSFVNLNIFPSRDDLLTPEFINKSTLANGITADGGVVIQPNIINGAYPTIEHYLDTQFKLLREDYLGPLREGISKYLENPTRKRHDNIRVYPRARVLRTYVSNNKVGHLIDLAWEERTHQAVKPVKHNNGLMFGSLLLFTNDKFNNFLCATVLDSSKKLLKDGYLAVSFHQPVSKNIHSETYLMLESEIFFEPYHQVLKVIQNSRLDSMPMKKYIVDVMPETRPPAYLTSKTIYTIEAEETSSEKSEIPFTVLDTNVWPAEHFKLDASQLEAFKFALTREFAVIQGPPGTGKTFLGVKIASTLLRNLSLEGTPMLVICYTNHALDQFLEGILKVTDSVIRLGSQSKSEKLEPYNLNNVRSKLKCKYSYMYSSKRAELERIYREMTELQSEVEKCESEIVCYRYIKAHLKIDGKGFDLKNCKEDCVLNWLFEHLEEDKISPKTDDLEVDSWENFEGSDFARDKVETCFSEIKAQNEVKSVSKMIKHITSNADTFNDPEVTRKLEREIVKISKRLECFKSSIASYKNPKDAYKIDKVEDLYTLCTKQRWQLYFNAVAEVKNELLSQMDTLLEKHKTASEELEEVATLIDEEVISTARVVGVTTTAAARRHQLITKMKSPIVIVEEAAQVLEAHIIASLTLKCQHLILIGDHKQLRPPGANYRLVKDHNIDISLFERMIRNGIHARTLTTQRRMRPNFVQLLVPEIYDRLDSHESVLRYPNINGVTGNLYFFTHEEPEDYEARDDGWSHSNRAEAEWCIYLAKYLSTFDYKPSEITILTTYKAQASFIEKMIREREDESSYLSAIKVTTVDNFQGEENRIVILSLVRSNRDGRIGFLSATNRICVALSRAKEGFYIIGNMNMLRSVSPLWKSIYNKLIAQNAVGDKISQVVAGYKAHQSLRKNQLA